MEQFKNNTFSSQVDEINKHLDEFIVQTKTKCIILITKDGQVITNRGEVAFINITALAALVAGSFAATKEVASLLGEREFSILLQQGKKRHVHISLISDIAMMVVVFENDQNIGKIRFYAKKISNDIMKSLIREGSREEEKVRLELTSFKEYATNLIDNIFADEDDFLNTPWLEKKKD